MSSKWAMRGRPPLTTPKICLSKKRPKPTDILGPPFPSNPITIAVTLFGNDQSGNPVNDALTQLAIETIPGQRWEIFQTIGAREVSAVLEYDSMADQLTVQAVSLLPMFPFPRLAGLDSGLTNPPTIPWSSGMIFITVTDGAGTITFQADHT